MDTVTWAGNDVTALADRAELLRRPDRRAVLGIAGAPAAGKSTLAELLLAELQRRHPDEVVLVGMDAFHLGQSVLERHGLAPVKGAPQTFDALGYAAVLRRIRETDETVFAPEFRREIEDSIAQTVEVTPRTRLVLTEGNYLLLPTEPWTEVRPLLDEAWFVHLEDDERRRRMINRHRRFGRSLEMATARTMGSDESNAVLVNSAQNKPDLLIEHTGS